MSKERLTPEKRLTKRTQEGAALNVDPARHLNPTIDDAIERLAQYEDTLANPERVAYMMGLSMPKLPKLEWYRYGRYWWYFCGNCMSQISRVATEEHPNAGDFCANCGQRVDWRVWLHEEEFGGVKKR